MIEGPATRAAGSVVARTGGLFVFYMSYSSHVQLLIRIDLADTIEDCFWNSEFNSFLLSSSSSLISSLGGEKQRKEVILRWSVDRGQQGVSFLTTVCFFCESSDEALLPVFVHFLFWTHIDDLRSSWHAPRKAHCSDLEFNHSSVTESLRILYFLGVLRFVRQTLI